MKILAKRKSRILDFALVALSASRTHAFLNRVGRRREQANTRGHSSRHRQNQFSRHQCMLFDLTNRHDASLDNEGGQNVTKEVGRTVPFVGRQKTEDADHRALPNKDAVADAGIEVPSVRTILSFAVPAIGVWLCSPLLSMIDTSTVGLFAGTVQQAALNPAVAVTDYSARTMSFLYTGTTNIIAVAQERDRCFNGRPTTARAFLGALHLSLWTGAALGVALIAFTRPMLRGIIGNDVMDPAIFSASMKYVRIRALGMPAAALIGTAQAACLGMKDVKSPLNVILVASVVNLVLDLCLVGLPQPWIGGAAGAAWATLVAQWTAAGLFLQWLGRKPARDVAKMDFGESLKASKRQLQHPNSFSTRGFLSGRINRSAFWKQPESDVKKGFQPYVVPVTTTQVGRCSTYVAMGHVVSSSLGIVPMAANQIVTSIFYTLIPVADSLSLTAQTFLPRISTQPDGPMKAGALQQTILNLSKVAGICGLFLAAVVACIPAGLTLFTADEAVVSLVQELVPILVVIFSLHGVFCGAEGVLLGQRDLGFLGCMYALFFVVVPTLMLRVKAAALRGAPVGLASVWNLFLAYQLFRIATWVSRVAWLQRQTNRRGKEAQTSGRL
jgi:Na+-driven multidrug efflux pump